MEESSDICSDFQLKKCLYGRRLHQDRISSLPDEILLFILSFLSFKEVVKTSLLSRRWLDLWVHTPVLDIQAPVTKSLLINDMERRNYIELVNHVLRRHKCPYLEEFKIVCSLDKCNEKDIERTVQTLISFCYIYSFPNYIYSVTSEAINFFLLDCPFLEHLEVVGTFKLVNLVISDPTLVLKYLKIEFCYNLKVLTISNFNLVSLEIPSVNDLTLTNLPMLVELSIHGTSQSLSRSFSQASSFFSQLEAFTLMGFIMKDATLLCNTDQLTKLKRLVIKVGAFDDESLTMFISIINSCPHLEEFVLKLGWLKREQTMDTSRNIIIINNNNKVEGSCGSSSPKSKSLKVFFGYYGHDRDVELIMHAHGRECCWSLENHHSSQWSLQI